MFLSNKWVKEEITGEIRKYFDMNENEKITYQNLCDSAMNTGCIYLLKLEFLSFPDKCPGVGLLDHMVTLFLVF